LTGTVGRSRPGCPAEERGELADIIRIGDPVRLGTAVTYVGSKDRLIIVLDDPVRFCPRVTPGDCVFDEVVSVLVKFDGDPLSCRLWAERILPITADQQLGCLVEILGGEIRA
jgi:hypothetical protein